MNVDEKEPCLHDDVVENRDDSGLESDKGGDSKSFEIEVHKTSTAEKQLCLDDSGTQNCEVENEGTNIDEVITNVEVVHIEEVELNGRESSSESNVNQEQSEFSDDSSKEEKDETKKVIFP